MWAVALIVQSLIGDGAFALRPTPALAATRQLSAA
jgi:hypothetical protein